MKATYKFYGSNIRCTNIYIPGFPKEEIVSLIAQLVKNLPKTQETLVQFLGWEDPLEKGIPWASLMVHLVKNPPTGGFPGSVPGLGRSPGEGISYLLQCPWASLMVHLVKNPPTMREAWV